MAWWEPITSPCIRTNGTSPTARTSGSASGSSSSASGPCDASARDAATMVAVAPTLDAGPQVSPSVRPLLMGAAHVEHVAHAHVVVLERRKSVGREQFSDAGAVQRPAAVAQVRGRLVALFEVDEPRHVEIETVRAP